MKMTLPKPGRAHAGALPAHKPMGTTHLWFHHLSFDVSVHGFLPILLNLFVEKAFS